MNLSQLDDEQIDEHKMLVVPTFKFMLSHTVKKNPIKIAEIVKHCLRSEIKLFDRIFGVVSNMLSDIYGLQTHVIKDDKMGKFVLCTSKVVSGSAQDYTESQRIELRLLFIVLSYIYMKGEPVTESTLMAFLKKIDIEHENHKHFGDFKRKISETFVKQMYLKREKIEMESGNIDDRFQYRWGYRAALEFPKKEILETVSEIFGKPSTDFMQQHAEVYGEDGDNQ